MTGANIKNVTHFVMIKREKKRIYIIYLFQFNLCISFSVLRKDIFLPYKELLNLHTTFNVFVAK